MSLLAATGLTKAFGGVIAAKNVSLSVEAGELVALIGPNGAGKSTTFNMIGGQLRPDRGAVPFDGKELAGLEPRVIWPHGVGRTFQLAQPFISPTVGEHVHAALQTRPRTSYPTCQRPHPTARAEAAGA